MSFFPQDPSKYRPSKILFKIDVLREADRAVQEGLGGYTNRHELVNDLVEQGLIGLRYPEREPVAPEASSEAEIEATANGNGDATGVKTPTETIAKTTSEAEPLSDISETRIVAPAKAGAAVENELAAPEPWPLFGMHNRDAPTAWALIRLAEKAVDGPIPLEAFYEKVTVDAWALAAQLEPMEVKGAPKLAVMLPRNRQKPQSATVGFRAFALGTVARKPNDEGKLSASGPFFQWAAVALVGDVKDPEIGLDFSLPHSDKMTTRFLAHLARYAPADLWGFRTALEGAEQGAGRVGMNEYFRKRLQDEFPEVEWKNSVADSVASGYVSRARAWGLIEPKLEGGKYVLTPAGDSAAHSDLSATPTA